MQTATLLDFRRPTIEGAAAGANWVDIFGPMPELPRPRQRWTVRRKAAVIEAVHGGASSSSSSSASSSQGAVSASLVG